MARTARKTYKNLRGNTKRRGLLFDIQYHDWFELTLLPCYLCGHKPTTYQGLDRIDNDLGYILDNVAPCCFRCNVMKRELTVGELECHLKKMLKGLKLYRQKGLAPKTQPSGDDD